MQALLVDESDERKAFRVARQAGIYDAKVVMPSKFANRSSPEARELSPNSSAAIVLLQSTIFVPNSVTRSRRKPRTNVSPTGSRMTKDGMLLTDGEIVRKRPVEAINFKIGPTDHDDAQLDCRTCP